MYPDLMPYFYAMKKLGYRAPGQDLRLGESGSVHHCDNIIRNASLKINSFSKEDIEILKKAKENLVKHKLVKRSELLELVDIEEEDF